MNRMNHIPDDVDTWLGCYWKEKWISAKLRIAVAIHYAAPNLLQGIQVSMKYLLSSQQFACSGIAAVFFWNHVRSSVQGRSFHMLLMSILKKTAKIKLT